MGGYLSKIQIKHSAYINDVEAFEYEYFCIGILAPPENMRLKNEPSQNHNLPLHDRQKRSAGHQTLFR